MDIRDLQREVHAIALSKGWWEEPRSFGDIIALCHSELSEALEEYRDRARLIYYEDSNPEKPEGIAVELADEIIRILDWAAYNSVDMASILRLKVEYNRTRPHRHGGKRL